MIATGVIITYELQFPRTFRYIARATWMSYTIISYKRSAEVRKVTCISYLRILRIPLTIVVKLKAVGHLRDRCFLQCLVLRFRCRKCRMVGYQCFLLFGQSIICLESSIQFITRRLVVRYRRNRINQRYHIIGHKLVIGILRCCQRAIVTYRSLECINGIGITTVICKRLISSTCCVYLLFASRGIYYRPDGIDQIFYIIGSRTVDKWIIRLVTGNAGNCRCTANSCSGITSLTNTVCSTATFGSF